MLFNKNVLIVILAIAGIGFGIDPYAISDDEYVGYGGVDDAGLGKIGDFPFPTNPMNDRAIGYLLKGKTKNAVTNYGNFISWDEHPFGMWGDYLYLPNVSFLAGVPGHSYSYLYNWETEMEIESGDVTIWCSDDAHDAWYDNGDTNFVGVVFKTKDDKGQVGSQVGDIISFTAESQWMIDDSDVCISLPSSNAYEVSPENANVYGDPTNMQGVGLIFPWAMRPAFSSRPDEQEFERYDYGEDAEEWTSDDNYEYYGATTTESWFTRRGTTWDTDWHSALKSRQNTHNLEVDAGQIFGDTPFTDENNTFPLLAHSAFSETWPVEFNEETAQDEPYWPGWWAEDYYGDEDQETLNDLGMGDCTGTRKDPECWKEVPGRFISDNDVYMEFDDRWAHRGNRVTTNDEYEQAGYPMGLRVMAEAHSYGVAYAEDIMFVTVRVRNESGDWCAFEKDRDGIDVPVTDENGEQVCGDAMIMPDGTKLRRGAGFNYQNVFLGFYMDADALSGDINGYNSGLHTNADDFMEYYDERFKVLNDSLIISMAMIYDFDGFSGSASSGLGRVATQMLDTPLTQEEVDLDLDGFPDRYPGEPLKMTDWHWFDWYSRPGVVSRESNSGPFAGAPGVPQALNKEEIQFKLMAGDTTNLSASEKAYYFHTPNPDTDLDIELNPHFDSLEGLEEEDAFQEGEDGLDCVFIMSCGPFDLDVGEEAPFSFSIIFGEDMDDLVKNARFAQIMYNSHYQGFTPPTVPQVASEVDHNKVTLTWSSNSMTSSDVVTGYTDFEGFKIYKSLDGGNTWGDRDSLYDIYDDMLTDIDGVEVGWEPIAQFDLSAWEDSSFCVYNCVECGEGLPYNNNLECMYANQDNPSICCAEGLIRNVEISGRDLDVSPWFDYGSNTGIYDTFYNTDTGEWEFTFTDTTGACDKCGVIDGMEYTYSVTAYDMGVEKPISVNLVDNGSGVYIPDTVAAASNPFKWADPDGYQSIENSKGTTIHDPNFVTVIPSSGYNPNIGLEQISVVPNPYIVHSQYSETEWVKKLRFTNVPPGGTVKIFTISGELVVTLNTDEDYENGSLYWNLRTINNQEVAPGLYLFAAEYNGDKHLGKFAVVR